MSENDPERQHEEARRKRLGLKPDESEIDRRELAVRVLDGRYPLERHERLLIARLLDPVLVAAITKTKKGAGRSKSNATALKADQIAELYFDEKALNPDAKHKEEIAPHVADWFGVTRHYVDKVLKKLDPVRRAELEAKAASFAKRYAKFLTTPQGIQMMAENAEVRRKLAAAKRSGSHLSSKRG